MKPRILFQSHNRRGLGHLMRGLNLARAIHRLDGETEIVFHARNASAEEMCRPLFRAIVESESSPSTHWAEVVRALRPDVVVYDTMLPNDPSEALLTASARRVFVMRKVKEDKQDTLLSHPFLDHIDVVIIPHTRDEFGQDLPPSLDARSAFVGPIVRMPDPTRQTGLRARYGLQPGEFLLTSTVGGGGFAEQAEAFFEAVYGIHQAVRTVVPRLRHLVIQGPNFQRALAAAPGMTVVPYEPDLIDLLAISDLVIAEGGYNTVHEIRVARTPAVFLPSSRNLDDQEERVRMLERRGLGAVFAGVDTTSVARGVADLCAHPAWFSDVRRRYATDELHTGNVEAAQRILALARATGEGA